MIEGNDQTPDWAILRFVRMRPGQVLDYRELEAARKALSNSGLFDMNEPPTIEIQPDALGGAFCDIRIRVKERPGNWVKFQLYDLVIASQFRDARLLLHVVYMFKEKLAEGR